MLFSLTPRRRETLDELQRLTQQAGAAVHYSLVGARMRISAWTAYGLLRELEAMGLVVRRYALGGNAAGGRSRILFEPSSPARVEGDDEAPLRLAFERFAAIPDDAAAVRAYLAEGLAGAGNDLAWHLGFWLGRLEAAGRNARDASRTLLEGGGLPAAKMQAVAALGLGSTLARLRPARLASRLTAASSRFAMLLEEAGRASDARLTQLVDAARRLEATSARRLVT
jgi:hypothetical protein